MTEADQLPIVELAFTSKLDFSDKLRTLKMVWIAVEFSLAAVSVTLGPFPGGGCGVGLGVGEGVGGG